MRLPAGRARAGGGVWENRFLGSLCWSLQALLQYLEPNVFHNSEYRAGVVGMECLFQLMQVMSVMMTSWKYTRHIEEARCMSWLPPRSVGLVKLCRAVAGGRIWHRGRHPSLP